MRKKGAQKTLFPVLSFILGLLAGSIVFGGVLLSFSGDFENLSTQLEDFTPSLTTRVYDIRGRLIGEFFTERREYARLEEIPPLLQKAFIASEDQNFYRHPGVDLSGILRALWQNLLNLRVVEGGSTITQQLSRSRFLDNRRNLERKIKEVLLALILERRYTKDEILEAYLNQIYLGHGVYGVRTAARLYFGKDLRELNLAEMAMLAGIARSPSHFSPYIDLAAAQRQQRRVLRRMLECGFITKEDYEKALSTPLVLSGLERRASICPYFLDYLLKELRTRFEDQHIFSGGLKVYTTLDADVQKVANEALARSGYQGAILCIDPKNGYIKAMVGGRSYEESKFNRATQAHRQPGSTFKPFIYAAALDSGFTPSTVLVDEPLEFPNGWKPQNYERIFRGPMTLREALEKSVNIIGIKLLQETGVDKVIQYAKRMGIQSTLRRDLSLALGTSEVTLLELTTAYAAFANGGMVPEPVAILRVEDMEGRILYKATPALRKALSPETAYIMARLLQGVVERGTGRRAAIGRPVAGKTGTTEDFIDAWFVGFTPDLVCGVFLGNDDRKPLGPQKTGGIIAAPIFAHVMQEALKNVPPHDFSRPEGVVEIAVCAKTGLLPSPSCTTVYLPYKRGTTPQAVCTSCP
ncbi:penicillin-binding protein 1A [Candidatus Caldatribacterium sp.]|uniref:penicillin-binding protein 1A n=1 Tax=Candidatus Caldatribacterium sp. TaxID=2282143 RepID=UPI0038445622|nr:penicillin-binding protein 1A [Candidatus Caldatribacterium sp.]